MRETVTTCLLLLCVMLTYDATAAVEATGDRVERPLIARPATTTRTFNMDVYGTYVDGLALQEADSFRGWTIGFDATVPLNRAMQLRLLLPVRTEGEAVLRSNGEDIDIEGWSGIFDFATLYFEHQLVGRDGGVNRFGYYLGLGWRTGVLETGTPDKYNHQGRSAHLGARYERRLSGGGALLLDLEYRSYEVSDDLNPASLHDDRFDYLKVTGAWMGARRGAWTPAVEITSDMVITGYAAASLVPEIFVRAGKDVELKLGAPIGLTTDAPDWGAELRATLTF